MRIVGYVTGAVEKIVSAATWKVISATKTTASWIEVTWWQQSHPILIGAASCAVLGAALYRYPVRDVIIPVGTAASFHARTLIIAALCGLSACTVQLTSSVAPMSPEDARLAAGDITQFVAQRSRPKDGPISVTHPPADTWLYPALIGDLQEAGYTVTPDSKRMLRYSVANLPAGTVLRATFGKAHAARLYQTGAGQPMAPSGPMSIQEAAE